MRGQKHEVVTAGLGEFTGLDYLAAARTCDGGTAIAYMPSARTVTADLEQMCGRELQAWWFDPRKGEAQPAGVYPSTGCRELAPPAAGDWVLVLDDVGRGYAARGAGGSALSEGPA